MKIAVLAWMASLIYLASACGGVPENMDRPEDRSVSSRISRGSAGELLVAVTYSGGGAGDTVHRLLACPSSAGSCELLASVDTNGRPPPALVPEGSRIAFLINESDYLGGFRNHSHSLPGLKPGTILIRSRSSPSPLR